MLSKVESRLQGKSALGTISQRIWSASGPALENLAKDEIGCPKFFARLLQLRQNIIFFYSGVGDWCVSSNFLGEKQK